MKELKDKGFFGGHCSLCIDVGQGGGSDNAKRPGIPMCNICTGVPDGPFDQKK